MEQGTHVIAVAHEDVEGGLFYPTNELWKQERFPPHPTLMPKGTSYTPQMILQAIQDYASCGDGIHTILDEHKIRPRTFYLLIRLNPEVQKAYNAARRMKTMAIVDTARNLYDEKIPEEFYEYDKNGCRRLSIAAIRYLENKHACYLRHAEISETGTVRQTAHLDVNQNIQSRNFNVTIGTDTASVNDLINAVKSLGVG